MAWLWGHAHATGRSVGLENEELPTAPNFVVVVWSHPYLDYCAACLYTRAAYEAE